MERIEFAKIKAGVPIDAVLSHYNVRTKKVNNTYLRADCPLPSHTSKESKESFAVNVALNLWTCKSDSCNAASGKKGGDVIDLLCLMENLRNLEAAKMLSEWFPYVKNGESPPPTPHAVSGENKPLAFTLKDVNPEHGMIQARGISVETAKEFGVGYFPGKGSMAARIVFPLYENGAHVGYLGRAAQNQEPQWLMGKGVVKSFLYGFEKCNAAKPLILCESPWAVLWFYQRGLQCASLLGKELTEEQERWLEPFGTIIVGMDNDAKGKEAAEKIARRLKGKHKVIRATLME